MIFDSFYTKDGYEIQVKCYDSIVGGFLNEYNIGDSVPDECIGLDFEQTFQYGANYNLFPYNTEEYVIIIRNSIYIDAIKFNMLQDENVKDVKCYNKYGDELNIHTVNDYINLKIQYEKYSNIYRSNFMDNKDKLDQAIKIIQDKFKCCDLNCCNCSQLNDCELMCGNYQPKMIKDILERINMYIRCNWN